MLSGRAFQVAESNGSLPPGLWLTPPACLLLRTGISSGTLRSVIEYRLPLPLPFYRNWPCIYSMWLSVLDSGAEGPRFTAANTQTVLYRECVVCSLSVGHVPGDATETSVSDEAHYTRSTDEPPLRNICLHYPCILPPNHIRNTNCILNNGPKPLTLKFLNLTMSRWIDKPRMQNICSQNITIPSPPSNPNINLSLNPTQ